MNGKNLPTASIVRQLRQEKFLSQVALAKRAGLSPAQLCKLEAGEHEATGSTLRRLAEALDVSVAILIGEGKPERRRVPVRRVKPEAERAAFLPVLQGLLPQEDVAEIAAEVVSYERAVLKKESELGVASGASLQLRYPYGLDEASAELFNPKPTTNFEEVNRAVRTLQFEIDCCTADWEEAATELERLTAES